MKEPRDGSGPVWMLRNFDRVRRQATDNIFSDLKLQNPAQHFLLFVIERCCRSGTPPTQGEIAKNLQLAPATVTASLRLLEKLGFIQRTPDESDLRKNRVLITESGKQMAKQCKVRLHAMEDAMFEGFSEQEQAQLASFFKRMSDNLETITKKEMEDQKL